MIPTTNALLICLIFLCGLGNTVLSQHGHCTGNQCFAVFQRPGDFSGAQTGCKDSKGQLLMLSLNDTTTIPTILPSGLNGSYWLELRSTGRTTEEAAAGTPLQNCSSISVSMGSNFAVSWEPCREHLDGFLCQYTFSEGCSGLQAAGGAQVKYTAQEGFEVKDSDSFSPATIAVAEKVGGKYADSKHVCAFSKWNAAPWKCEVLKGGCEHDCNSTTNTCTCPAGQTLQPNKFTCAGDPCSDCAQECQREGDTYVCKCRKGYRLAQDGKNCVDVNECEEENPCTREGEECQNTQGTFECRCKEDFVEEDGECVNISICDKCEHMLCEKSNGVYKCACRKGFIVSAIDPNKCDLVCKERDCPARCDPNKDELEVDMLQCYCLDGYIRDTKNNTPICTDINECENQKQCDHKCENFFGGYRCLCDEGFKLHKGHKCVPIEDEDEEDGSGSTPSYPTPVSPHSAAVPSYIKTGSVLGTTVFVVLSVVLLFFLVRNAVKRCGKFELSSFKHSNIDIFYLQQVTTETYKRLSFDKQFKNDPQIL